MICITSKHHSQDRFAERLKQNSLQKRNQVLMKVRHKGALNGAKP